MVNNDHLKTIDVSLTASSQDINALVKEAFSIFPAVNSGHFLMEGWHLLARVLQGKGQKTLLNIFAGEATGQKMHWYIITSTKLHSPVV